MGTSQVSKMFAIAATLLVCDLSLAADNCTGYDVLVTQATETTDLGKGQTLTFVRQASVLITEDAPIYNLVSGECQGSILTTPDGKTRASGHCARRDGDGDSGGCDDGKSVLRDQRRAPVALSGFGLEPARRRRGSSRSWSDSGVIGGRRAP